MLKSNYNCPVTSDYLSVSVSLSVSLSVFLSLPALFSVSMSHSLSQAVSIQPHRAVCSQISELDDELGRLNGIECRTILNEQHSHICDPLVEVGEGSVEGEGDGVVRWYIWSICILQWVQ